MTDGALAPHGGDAGLVPDGGGDGGPAPDGGSGCTGSLEVVAEWDAPIASPNVYYPVRPDLAIDAAHGLHVYYNADLTSVEHAYRPAGGAWSNATLAAGVGGYGEIAVDAQGVEHVCYVQAYAGSSGPVACGTAMPGAPWTGAVVDGTASIDGSWDVSMAPDGAGGYYVAHGRAAGAWLEHLDAGGSPTSSEQVSARFTMHTSLAVDPRSRVHLVLEHYQDVPTLTQIAYLVRDGETWTSELQLDESGTMSPRALALDPSGRAHLSYLSYVRWQTHYRELAASGGAWSDDIIDEATHRILVEPETVAMPDSTARVAYVLRDNNAHTDDLRLGVSAPPGTLAMQEVTPITPYAAYQGGVALARDGDELHLIYESYSLASSGAIHHVLRHVAVCAGS